VTFLNFGKRGGISQTVQGRDIIVIKKTNMKSLVAYRSTPIIMIWSDLKGHFSSLKPF